MNAQKINQECSISLLKVIIQGKITAHSQFNVSASTRVIATGQFSEPKGKKQRWENHVAVGSSISTLENIQESRQIILAEHATSNHACADRHDTLPLDVLS